MTTFVAQAPYAEDQQHAKSILRFHVARSGLTMGAILALPSSIASTLFWGPRNISTLSTRLLVHSYRGTVGGLLFGVLATEMRMFGRDEIEWQDRSWRLLSNKGQVEVDNWILGGGALGALRSLIFLRPPRLPISFGKILVAAVGAGTAAGTLGYVGWRYGVQGGKWPEEIDKDVSESIE